MRSLISYYFTEKYGENQAHYLDTNHFTSTDDYRRDVSRLINTLSDLACTNTNYPYINYQRENYRNVPLWVLFNSTTLGTLSKFYSFMTSDLKVKVSKNFDGVNESQLKQYLRVITKFRNVCAHGDRLFTYNTHDSIPDTPLHQKLGIAKRGAQYIYGKTDLFAIVIAFRYFLPSEDFLKFKASLNRIIKHYLRSSVAITEVELLPMMGFPQNWAKISSYKK